MRTYAFILGSCALLTDATMAQGELKQSAWQGSVAQDQLRGDTRRVKAELLALIDEYGRYSSAAADIQKVKEAAGDLANLDEKEMLALVEALRTASRQSGDEAGGTLAASEEAQRKIEVRLRDIADRLTRERMMAEMKLRLEKLALRQAANLRETERLSEQSANPNRLPREERLPLATAAAEQRALTPELKMVSEQLQKAAANEADKKTFEEVAEKLKAAEAAAAAQQAEQNMTGNLPQAATEQKKVEQALKEAIATLDAAATPEARLNEAAAKLESQAARQESLAQAPRQSDTSQKTAAKVQGELADRLDLTQPQTGDLKPEVAEQLEQATKQSEELAQQNNADPAQQKALAEKLENLSKEMREQAAQMAQEAAAKANQNSEQGQQPPQLSAADLEQMRELADKLAEAKEQLQDAKQGEQAGAEKAGQELAAAQEMTQAAGEALPKEIGENVAKAGEKAGEGKEGMAKEGQGAAQNFAQAQEHIDKALQGLAKAEAQAKQGQGQAKNGNKPGKPKSGVSGTGDPGKKASEASSTADANSDINNPSTRREAGVREALSLLQQEKAPAGYEEKVQQYIRTLAEGEAPVK